MSFNVIRSSKPVAVCTKLTELYLAANKFRTIENVDRLNELIKLDLGANRLREIPSLPPNIKHLFLGKNRIESISGLEALKDLRVLDVQSNRLTSLKNAFSESQAHLSELYLAHNAIGQDLSASDLEPLKALGTIDLSHNRITTLNPFAPLHALEDLWLSYNQVPSLDAIAAIVHLPLACIYLEHNPCAIEPRYVTFLRETFSNINQIDAIAYPPLSSNNPVAVS